MSGGLLAVGIKKERIMMKKKIKSYKDLLIWQDGIKLVKHVYGLTKCFPDDERFSLTSQMRRAAVSVPSNIAEGFRRQYNKEFKQFLYISISSLAELETQIIISEELGFINKAESNKINKTIDALSRMTMSLINKIQNES